MAENAICLCKPGTIPLYNAVAPSFLTIETRVPNWDLYSYEGLNHEEEDGDNDDNMLVRANKDDDYDGDDDDDDDSLLLEAAMLLHPWRSAPLGLEVAPLLSMMIDNHMVLNYNIDDCNLTIGQHDNDSIDNDW